MIAYLLVLGTLGIVGGAFLAFLLVRAMDREIQEMNEENERVSARYGVQKCSEDDE